jgi:hypothetical protein
MALLIGVGFYNVYCIILGKRIFYDNVQEWYNFFKKAGKL